jgi:ATP-dependent protease ClpP protease subunit
MENGEGVPLESMGYNSLSDSYAKQTDEYVKRRFQVIGDGDLRNVNLESPIYGIIGEFNPYMEQYVIDKCNEAVRLGYKTAVFMVDSPGGEVDSCKRILDKIDEMRTIHGIKVVALIDGMAASCAQVFTAYCCSSSNDFREGGSFMLPHSSVLAHQVSSSMPQGSLKTGKISELARDLSRTNNEMFRMLDSRFEQKISPIIIDLVKSGSVLENDKFLDAREATALRLVDKRGHVILRASLKNFESSRDFFHIYTDTTDPNRPVYHYLDVSHTVSHSQSAWNDELVSQRPQIQASQAQLIDAAVQKIHHQTSKSEISTDVQIDTRSQIHSAPLITERKKFTNILDD